MSKRNNAKRRYRRSDMRANREWREQDRVDRYVFELLREPNEACKPIRHPKQRVKPRNGRLPAPRIPLMRKFDNGVILLDGYRRNDVEPLRNGFKWSMSLQCFFKVVSKG